MTAPFLDFKEEQEMKLLGKPERKSSTEIEEEEKC